MCLLADLRDCAPDSGGNQMLLSDLVKVDEITHGPHTTSVALAPTASLTASQQHKIIYTVMSNCGAEVQCEIASDGYRYTVLITHNTEMFSKDTWHRMISDIFGHLASGHTGSTYAQTNNRTGTADDTSEPAREHEISEPYETAANGNLGDFTGGEDSLHVTVTVDKVTITRKGKIKLTGLDIEAAATRHGTPTSIEDLLKAIVL
jgi:hypothetical protein